jgi:hypothetical protein
LSSFDWWGESFDDRFWPVRVVVVVRLVERAVRRQVRRDGFR